MSLQFCVINHTCNHICRMRAVLLPFNHYHGKRIFRFMSFASCSSFHPFHFLKTFCSSKLLLLFFGWFSHPTPLWTIRFHFRSFYYSILPFNVFSTLVQLQCPLKCGSPDEDEDIYVILLLSKTGCPHVCIYALNFDHYHQTYVSIRFDLVKNSSVSLLNAQESRGLLPTYPIREKCNDYSSFLTSVLYL